MSKTLYKKAIKKWGEQGQILVAIEELSELTQALIHYLRSNKKITKKEIASEIADVQIISEQMIMIFGVDKEVKEQRDFKLKRLKGYIER